jgi:hypothetical protein
MNAFEEEIPPEGRHSGANTDMKDSSASKSTHSSNKLFTQQIKNVCDIMASPLALQLPKL